MARAIIENLMTELHERFGELESSPQQERLLADLQAHVHTLGEDGVGDPTPVETVELMLENLGGNHPRIAAVLRELLDTLKNMGV